MSSGKIQGIDRELLVHRAEVQLPHAWVQRPTQPAPANKGEVLCERALELDAETHDPSGSDAPVLVMLRSLSRPVVEALLAYADAGRRVYVLAPARRISIVPELRAAQKILVRRTQEIPASGLHAGTWAQLWLGTNRNGEAGWPLLLDETQAADFRQLFLRIFWHEAKTEGWPVNRQIGFERVADRPFDVPRLSPSAVLRREAADHVLDDSGGFESMHIADGPLPSKNVGRLWIKPSSSGHTELAALVAGGTDVRWSELGFPDLAVGQTGGVALLPANGEHRLRIELNAQQAAEVTAVLAQDTPWSFEQNIQLGSVAGGQTQVWLPNQDTAAPVQEEQVITVPTLAAPSLRLAPSLQPESLPSPTALALSARYQWTVMPPLAPTGAKQDALVERWRAVDREWSTALTRTRSALEVAEGKRGRLGAALTGLVRALIGFKREHAALEKELDALTARTPSIAGPEAGAQLMVRLAALEENVNSLSADLSESERKERENLEREKQEQAWKARVEEARGRTPALREKTETTKSQRPAVEAKLAEIGAELATLNAAAARGDKKAPKKNEIRSLNATKGKVAKQLTDIDRDVARLADEIAANKQTTKEPFVFVPTPKRSKRGDSGKKGRFVPPASSGKRARHVPDEALPEIGDLRSHGGKRFLAISDWEELSAGEIAAFRLVAELVAKGGA